MSAVDVVVTVSGGQLLELEFYMASQCDFTVL